MTNKKWFFNVNGQVSGPFETSEIEGLLALQPNATIWGRGFPEWMTADLWTHNKLKSSATPVALDETFWKFRHEGKTHGPFSLEELINHLAITKDFDNIDVSMNGGPWKEIYTVGEVAAKLGLSRRAHSRVPILGVVYLELESGNIDFRAVTISEGGLGLSEAAHLQMGQKLKGHLKSANLFTDLYFTGTVVYVGNDGYVGVKFDQLPQESQSAIIEYINKFKEHAL